MTWRIQHMLASCDDNMCNSLMTKLYITFMAWYPHYEPV